MATKTLSRRAALSLVEIDALSVNALWDIRDLERRLIAVAPGLAIIAYGGLRLLEADIDCIRCELQEARR